MLSEPPLSCSSAAHERPSASGAAATGGYPIITTVVISCSAQLIERMGEQGSDPDATAPKLAGAEENDYSDIPMIKNALLGYLVTWQTPIESTKRAILGHFPSEAITEAKNMLWEAYPEPILGAITKRRGSQAKPKSDMELNDIIDALTKLDQTQNMPEILIPAQDLAMLPPRPEDMSPTMALMQRFQCLEEKVRGLCTENEILVERVRSLEKSQYERNLYSAIVREETTSRPPPPRPVPKAPHPVPQHHQQQPPREAARERKEPPQNDQPSSGAAENGGNGWEQQKGKRRRSPALKGAARESDSCFRGGPPPRRDLFLGRVMKSCTNEDIIDQLRKKGIERDITVECISNPEAKFKSFKVSCDVGTFSELMNPETWPCGTHFRQYKTRRPQPWNKDNNGRS